MVLDLVMKGPKAQMITAIFPIEIFIAYWSTYSKWRLSFQAPEHDECKQPPLSLEKVSYEIEHMKEITKTKLIWQEHEIITQKMCL